MVCVSGSSRRFGILDRFDISPRVLRVQAKRQAARKFYISGTKQVTKLPVTYQHIKDSSRD